MPTLEALKINAGTAAEAVGRLKDLYTTQRAHTWTQEQREAAEQIVARLAALRQYYGATSGEINDIITAISDVAAVDAAVAGAQGEAPDFAAVAAQIKNLEDAVQGEAAAAAAPPAGAGPMPPAAPPAAQPAVQPVQPAVQPVQPAVQPVQPAVQPGEWPRAQQLPAPAARRQQPPRGDRRVGFGSGASRGLLGGGGFRYTPKKRHRTTIGSSHKKTKSGRTSTRRRRKRSSIHGGSRASRRRHRSARSRRSRSARSRSARSRSSHRRRKY